jgi:hypothetical protein
MKATRKCFVHSFLVLLLFMWIAGAQNISTVSADFHEESAISEGRFDGIWEGTGYQRNPNENWTIKLTVQNDTYRIDYPSLSCGGEWKLISRDKCAVTFREKLTYGQKRCVDNVTVTMQKLNDSQIAVWYIEPNRTRVNSNAVLDRQ